MSEIDKKIDILVSQIVKTAHPLKIVLFGSVVSESTLPDSDIDVMVVMPEGTHRRQTAQRLYREITGVGMPFDLIVATPQDLKNHQNNIGLIYHSILRDGREIYAA